MRVIEDVPGARAGCGEQALEERFAERQGTHGKCPAAKPFAIVTISGTASKCSRPKSLAGAPKARHHFVVDQQDAVAVAEAAHGWEILRRRYDGPGRLQHRLGHYRRRRYPALALDECLEGLDAEQAAAVIVTPTCQGQR